MSKTTNKFAPEVRERAARMMLDHEADHPPRWAALVSISEKFGCVPQTLYECLKKAEVDSGKRARVPTQVADKVKALEREVRKLRQASEILRKASAYFAQAEFDRPFQRSPRCLWRRAVLPITLSTYHERVAQRQDPTRLSTRTQRDVTLKPEIARVFAENFAVYGARKVWWQMMREGLRSSVAQSRG